MGLCEAGGGEGGGGNVRVSMSAEGLERERAARLPGS